MVMDPDVVVEATRLVDAANAAGCTVRVMGGVAVSLHAHGGIHPALRRTYRDIDLVAAKKQGKPTLKMLEAAGYEPNERFNAMNGGRRLVVYDMQNGRQLDVFVGDFEMCHKIPIAQRLHDDPVTIPLAELLLTKLQVVHTNQKDVLDICAILLDHEIGDKDEDTVNARYIASLLAGDWGLWRTSRGTDRDDPRGAARARAGRRRASRDRRPADGAVGAGGGGAQVVSLAQPGQGRRSHQVVRRSRGGRPTLDTDVA